MVRRVMKVCLGTSIVGALRRIRSCFLSMSCLLKKVGLNTRYECQVLACIAEWRRVAFTYFLSLSRVGAASIERSGHTSCQQGPAKMEIWSRKVREYLKRGNFYWYKTSWTNLYTCCQWIFHYHSLPAYISCSHVTLIQISNISPSSMAFWVQLARVFLKINSGHSYWFWEISQGTLQRFWRQGGN